jgi:hypothetical protein
MPHCPAVPQWSGGLLPNGLRQQIWPGLQGPPLQKIVTAVLPELELLLEVVAVPELDEPVLAVPEVEDPCDPLDVPCVPVELCPPLPLLESPKS